MLHCHLLNLRTLLTLLTLITLITLFSFRPGPIQWSRNLQGSSIIRNTGNIRNIRVIIVIRFIRNDSIVRVVGGGRLLGILGFFIGVIWVIRVIRVIIYWGY